MKASVAFSPPKMGVFVPLTPDVSDLEMVVSNWSSNYEILTNAIHDDEIVDNMAPVGFVLQDIEKELDTTPNLAVSRLQNMMQSISEDMRKTLYEWQHLITQDKRFVDKWAEDGMRLELIYKPWKEVADIYIKILFNKLGEYYDYRRAPMEDIISNAVSPPQPIDTSTFLMIKGVNGVGYVPIFNDGTKAYDRLSYQGFILPREDDNSTTKAFYYGKVSCNSGDLKDTLIAGPAEIGVLTTEIDTYGPNYCIASASPSDFPSASPSKQHGCNRPTSRLRLVSVYNKGCADGGGGMHELSVHVNDVKVWPNNAEYANIGNGGHNTWARTNNYVLNPDVGFRIRFREHDYSYPDDYDHVINYGWCNGSLLKVENSCYWGEFTYDM